MSDTHVRLSIADVEVELGWPEHPPRLAPQLLPFRRSECAGSTPALKLEFMDGPPPARSLTHGEPVEGRHAMRVTRSDEGLWFERHASVLFASDDFSHAQAWSAIDAPSRDDPFDGMPWVMLCLWGYLSQHNGCLLHGAICQLGDDYIMLLGDAEVGKTTLSGLLVEAGFACLTDEYPVLSWTGGTAMAHGTPWRGMMGEPSGLDAPLRAAFFLRHCDQNELRLLTPAQGGTCLVNNARFFTWDPSTILKTLDVLDAAARSVPIYDYGFVPTPDAAGVLRDVL